MISRIFNTLIFNTLLVFALVAQKGDIRGNVYDRETTQPIAFATVYLEGTTYGSNTNSTGFYAISGIPAGEYTLVASFIGFDTAKFKVKVLHNQIIYKKLFISESGVSLEEISISGKREQARTEVKMSTISVTPKEIKALPSTGGEADIAQYLQIIPGVISTGDQGGQIYIRGGSPVQNKILLDGMTIINPFHSIGIFSVFETEVIRNVEVMTGGFSAEHGGRVSAIVDIKTREGNKKRYGGLASVSPFLGKLVLEGPLSKYGEEKSNTSFLITGKHSWIDKTSPSLYSYALDSLDKLPFIFRDFYGKISTTAKNGSNLNFFGFSFNDEVEYSNIAGLNWNSVGGGTHFNLIPSYSSVLIGGTFAYSKYDIELEEKNAEPRSSAIKSFVGDMNFTYFQNKSEIKYGLEFNSNSTDFKFTNFLGHSIQQKDNNTELAGYLKYRINYGNVIFDPSLRLQYYAGLAKISLEPRFGFKWNITDYIRFKAAGGLYSQSLMSSVSERDIVNLFVGFITAPDLIKSEHILAGIEFDLPGNMELNVEPYYKKFSTLYNLNRNKRTASESNFAKETGDAYGIDLLIKKELYNWNLWLAYSLGFVNRNDGNQKYPALFDRRHNINLVANYAFGRKKDWELGARWNYGSGFAFTKVQGFFEDNKLIDGIDTDFVVGNPPIGIIYSSKINSGRLPDYHRLDMSIKKTFNISKFNKIELIGSVTNTYDRDNIFYFNVVDNKRVNQLPILPALTAIAHF